MTVPARNRSQDVLPADDVLREVPLVADEKPMEFEALEAALMGDLDPKTAYERVLVSNLVGLEWERRRVLRWYRALLAERAGAVLCERLKAAKVKGEQSRTVAFDWANGDDQARRAAEAVLVKHGIDVSTIMAQCHAEQSGQLKSLEAELQGTETRRRKLFADYEKLRSRRRARTPDADIADGSSD